MTATAEALSSTTLPESYFDLVREHPLRPVLTADDAAAAMATIRRVYRRGALDVGESTYVSALGSLLHVYERQHGSRVEVTVPEMLEFLIESKGVTQTDVAEATGISTTMIAAVINGTRSLHNNDAVVLGAYFNINPAVFAG